MGTTSEPTTDTENSVTNKKLRIKILVKKPANEACKVSEVPEVNCVKKELSTVGVSKANVDEKLNCIKKVSSTYGGCKAGAGKEKAKSTLGSKQKSGACQSSKQVSKVSCLEKSSVNHKQVSTAICDGKLNPIAGCKRRSEEVLENHERKRLKMDASATLTCRNILKKLWNQYHESAKEFLQMFDGLWKPIKMRIDGQHRDIKEKGFENNNTACNVNKKHMERVSGCSNKKVLPRRSKECEGLKNKLVVEKQSIDLKTTVKDDELEHKRKRTALLSSKTQSAGYSGPASKRARPMPTKAKCENALGRKIVHDESNDLNALQKEWVMLLRRQKEERDELEARIKAVKSAAPFKKEFELKQQRQAEREAARIANEKMEMTVFINDNWQVMKDFEELIGQPLYVKEECQVDNGNAVSIDDVLEELEKGEIRD